MTKLKAMSTLILDSSLSGKLVSTTRTSWMANNTMPDSIITNMICRSLVPPVDSELNEPNVCSTKVAFTSKNTVRILNTIKLVTRAFTTMDAAKDVKINLVPQGVVHVVTCTTVTGASDTSQVTRGNFESACQLEMKIVD